MARIVVDADELVYLAAGCRQDAADVRSLAVGLGGQVAQASLSLLIAYGLHVGDVLARLAMIAGGPDGLLGLSTRLGADADHLDDVRRSFESADEVAPSQRGAVLGGGRGDPDGRSGGRIENDRRTGTPEGGRRSPESGSNFDNDWAGRAILGRYLSGGSDWTIVDDPRWTSYMTSNPRLAEQLRPRVENAARDALAKYVSSGAAEGGVDEKFNAEFENGEGVVGYQYLHGTNADVGDFTIRGDTLVSRQPDGTYEVRLTAEYTWNDIIDPNVDNPDTPEKEGYETDERKSRLAELITLGRADPYAFHCTWTKETVVRLDAEGNIISVGGYLSG